MKTEVSIGFEYAADAIVVTDATGRVLLANRSLTQVTGLKREKVLGHRMHDLLEQKIVSDSAVVRVMAAGAPKTVRTTTIAGKENINSACPVFDIRKNLQWIVCNVKDIRELRSISVMDAQTVSKEAIDATT